ncbi:MAG: hypothetical protein ACK5M7_17810 [Draconibacterium sp.]
MRSFLFTLILVLASQLTFSNNNKKDKRYFPGGIISLNNDTIQASILMENITKMQNEVKFIDAGGKKKSFKPPMINGFFLQTEGGKMIFESRDDINLSAFPSKKGHFYYRVSNEVIPLYYYVTTRMENTGIESEMVEVKNYIFRMNLRWQLFTKENYKDCVKLFEDNRALVRDIENDQYEFEQFPEIIHRYVVSMQAQDN